MAAIRLESVYGLTVAHSSGGVHRIKVPLSLMVRCCGAFEIEKHKEELEKRKMVSVDLSLPLTRHFWIAQLHAPLLTV